MATFDRSYGTTTLPSEADARLDRPMRLDWSALFVSGVAAFSRTPVNNTTLHKNTRGQTAALVETTGNGPVVAIFAAGGAVLALVGSLLGALAAASRSSGVPFSDEFRLKRRS